MNNDLISREAVKKTIDKFIGYIDEDMIYRIKVAIDKVPTVLHDNYSMGYQDGVRKVLSENTQGDLISRRVLKEHFTEGAYTSKGVREIIDNAPTVEVTKPQSYVMGFCDGLKAQTYEKPPMFERPQGHWVKEIHPHDEAYHLKCSACGKWGGLTDKGYNYESDFCPNCGAKMGGD